MSVHSYILWIREDLLYCWKWKAFLCVLFTVHIFGIFKHNCYENKFAFVLEAEEAFCSDEPLLKG